jgi:hypothetical protein
VPIALRAAFGQDEASHGTARYRVGADRLLLVPPEAAAFLIEKGGFGPAKDREGRDIASTPHVPNTEPLVPVRHATARICSHGGCQYRAGCDGEFLVPADAVADLAAHGFAPVEISDAGEGRALQFAQQANSGEGAVRAQGDSQQPRPADRKPVR